MNANQAQNAPDESLYGALIRWTWGFIAFGGQIVSNSFAQIYEILLFTHKVNFSDHYASVDWTELDLKWTGIPGLIIGIPIALVQSLLTFLSRMFLQTLISWVNFSIRSYQNAKSDSLNDDDTPQDYFQIQQSNFEKKIGSMLWFLSGGFLCYLLTYVISFAFIVVVETNVRMFGSWIFYFLEISIADLEISLTDYPTLAIRDVFGWPGSLFGFSVGIILGMVITAIRFSKETLSGFYLGILGKMLDANQDEKTEYEIKLSIMGYLFGRFLRASVVLPAKLIYEVFKHIYFDKKHEPFVMDTHDMLLGSILGGIPAVVLAVLTGIILIVTRVLYESIISFIDALPKALSLKAYNDTNRDTMAQYGFGAPGLLLAYVPYVLIQASRIILAPFVALYKCLDMCKPSRFEGLDDARYNRVKNLFGLLNNLERVLPETIQQMDLTTNPLGGKGSFCFLGKALSLNQPSVAEIYLDNVLERQKSNNGEPLNAGDFDKILENISESSNCFWNTDSAKELERTHVLVSTSLLAK